MTAGKTSTDNLRSFWLLAPLLLLFIIAMAWGDGALSKLMLPSDGEQFIHQPWSIITYAFVHTYWRHFAINLGILSLLLLFAIPSKVSTSTALALFFAGTVVGGILFLLIGDGLLMGASAGITALIPLVIYHSFKEKQVASILLIFFVMLFDGTTQSKLIGVTYGVHLSGYLVGILSIFLIAKRGLEGDITPDSVSQKVNISGYHSLSKEERKVLHQEDQSICPQ